MTNHRNPGLGFAPLLQQFFGERLMNQQNVSPRTITAYRDAFRLFLLYMQTSVSTFPSTRRRVSQHNDRRQ